MNETNYVFRMDDACPRMDNSQWDRLETIFDRFHVKPVVAVIPNCLDESLRIGGEDPDFWEKVKRWQAKGWDIALHGYDHVYRGTARGLVPLNARTEFAGQPEEIQRTKIKQGWSSLLARGLNPTVWIAPAHTFDRTTLRCLWEETTIRIVSDGLSSRPFTRFGFAWIPQQIWAPRRCPKGVWTICLHPNTMAGDMPERVEKFLEEHNKEVTSIGTLPTPERSWGFPDLVFEISFRFVRPLKNFAANLLKRLGLRP